MSNYALRTTNFWWAALAALSLLALLSFGVVAAAPAPTPAPPAGPAPTPARPQPDDKPKAPRSVEVQVFAIMASKGDADFADPSLKELAGLLQRQFKDQFNRFSLAKSPCEDVRLDKTVFLVLVENYYLKITYSGLKAQPAPGVLSDRFEVTLTLVQHVQETIDGKVETREVTVVGPLRVSIVNNKFLLIAGPQVGDETLILAVRVRK